MAGSGRRDQHASSRQSMQDDGVALVAIDYAHFTDGAWAAADMDRATPILVCTDQKHGMLMAEVVPAKGLSPYVVEVLVRFLTWAGHPVIKLRSDGENPIKALATEVAGRMRMKGVRMVPEVTPKGDSQAGGVQESAVKRVKDKVRCLWKQATERHGVVVMPHTGSCHGASGTRRSW